MLHSVATLHFCSASGLPLTCLLGMCSEALRPRTCCHLSDSSRPLPACVLVCREGKVCRDIFPSLDKGSLCLSWWAPQCWKVDRHPLRLYMGSPLDPGDTVGNLIQFPLLAIKNSSLPRPGAWEAFSKFGLSVVRFCPSGSWDARGHGTHRSWNPRNTPTPATPGGW